MTASQDVTHISQAIGVPEAPMLNAQDQLTDPHLLAQTSGSILEV